MTPAMSGRPACGAQEHGAPSDEPSRPCRDSRSKNASTAARCSCPAAVRRGMTTGRRVLDADPRSDARRGPCPASPVEGLHLLIAGQLTPARTPGQTARLDAANGAAGSTVQCFAPPFRCDPPCTRMPRSSSSVHIVPRGRTAAHEPDPGGVGDSGSDQVVDAGENAMAVGATQVADDQPHEFLAPARASSRIGDRRHFGRAAHPPLDALQPTASHRRADRPSLSRGDDRPIARLTVRSAQLRIPDRSHVRRARGPGGPACVTMSGVDGLHRTQGGEDRPSGVRAPARQLAAARGPLRRRGPTARGRLRGGRRGCAGPQAPRLPPR